MNRVGGLDGRALYGPLCRVGGLEGSSARADVRQFGGDGGGGGGSSGVWFGRMSNCGDRNVVFLGVVCGVR